MFDDESIDIDEFPLFDIAWEGAHLPPDVFLYVIEVMANGGDNSFVDEDLMDKIDEACKLADSETKQKVLYACASCHRFVGSVYDVGVHASKMDL